MKLFVKQARCLLPALIGLMVMQTERPMAQIFTNFYSFQAASTNQSGAWTNQNGAIPTGAPLLLGGRLYGTTFYGGTNGTGCIYAVGTNGLGFVNLHTFSLRATNKAAMATNHDGADPAGGLIVSGSTLYGVTWYGGTNGQGTIFSINTNGTGFVTLHHFAAGATNSSSRLFTNSEGTTPFSGLTLSGATLYGATGFGGANGNGTVFAVQVSGLGFTNLHSFSLLVSSNNSDGANPYAPLLLTGGALYGTTQFGGTNGNGTIFSVATNGAGFANLHNFARLVDWGSGPYPNIYTNGDGANPRGQVVLVGNRLYGAGTFGGLYGYGAVFALATNGTSFTNLYNFAAGGLDLTDFGITNSDGAWPQPGVTWWDNALYGVCEYGGLGLGTVFSLGTNGGNFTVNHYFPKGSTLTILPNSSNSDGAYPQTPLVVSAAGLYSSAGYGGLNGSGALFDLAGTGTGTTPPALLLTLTRQNTNAVLRWPTNFTGYTLQFSTNLDPAAWFTATPSPAVAGTNYSVTNGISPANRFYRLLQ